MNREEILQIASHFCFEGTPTTINEETTGNINATYLMEYQRENEPDTHPYIMQRINTVAFPDPVSLMQNIEMVTNHIHNALIEKGVDPTRRVLYHVKAEDGSLLYRAPDGGAWRAYHYVDDATAHNQISSPDLFLEAGRGFGEFQTLLADFPAGSLTEIIPHFHDTPHRYEAFRAAVAADKVGRAKEITAEIAFFDQRADMMHSIVDLIKSGDLPLRVTHNDTKLNNVLLDDETGKALCVIDLDTVMPGSALYDYGDAVRFGECTAAEDEPDLDKIGFDMSLFEAFTKGFVEKTAPPAGNLTDTEICLLPLGVQVITCELAMRFLTDYLNGDVYFKIKYPEHNLVRARAQMKLLCEVEARMDEMNAFVRRFFKKCQKSQA